MRISLCVDTFWQHSDWEMAYKTRIVSWHGCSYGICCLHLKFLTKELSQIFISWQDWQVSLLTRFIFRLTILSLPVFETFEHETLLLTFELVVWQNNLNTRPTSQPHLTVFTSRWGFLGQRLRLLKYYTLWLLKVCFNLCWVCTK